MSKIRVLMTPHLEKLGKESGINRVVEAYFKYLPQFGIELVKEGEQFDLHAVHAGVTGQYADVAHLHGLYWTADYNAAQWEYDSNALIVSALRGAKQVTVPSAWVAETLQRDMRFTPHIVPHGIDTDEWKHNLPNAGYVLWNKNRVGDVCDPEPLSKLSAAFRDTQFLSTFAPSVPRHNIKRLGVVEHEKMKRYIQQAAVYLATTKETFGIGILEAMAAGVPVLGYKHGAIVDLIEHGVNGYLATPGDFEDLQRGLDYCLKNSAVLGENGTEMAKAWTWEEACQKIAEIYRLTLEPEKPAASIIIPCYNYGNKVGRAIESAMAQDYDQLESIVVVDDGSDDDDLTARTVSEYTEKDNRVKYIRKDNGGVATARNAGIDSVTSKYVCCLDADDAMEESFITKCVTALEDNTQLSIAYTGLRYILPSGETGVSQWPGSFEYDKQLQRKNQIPTCCVFEREMWKRLGGYKQRYAPMGAGAEDAEFWLRAGAYGYKAEKVTEAALFIYSWQSGRVSGDPDYKEVDWLAWHPWTRDGEHPFASLATPQSTSHAVRQYDEPVVSVVIPVGKGHEKHVINALDSLEAQTFRKWEVIVVDDSGGGCNELLDAYPYVRLVSTGGSLGAGYARNAGANLARGAFLLFLDADDWLYPEFVERTLDTYYNTGDEVAVYTDYVGKSHVDDISKLAKDLQDRVYHYDGEDAIIGYRAAEYDCEKAQRQPEGQQPYLWNNITTLFPTYWHNEIGGFDESMAAWEDVDYWYRMAHLGKCFVRLPQELMVYRFDTGSRRQSGLEQYSELIDYLKEKYKGVDKMGCRTCGGSPKVKAVHSAMEAQITADEGEVYVEYMGRNKGSHPIIGHRTKRRYAYAGKGWRGYIAKIDYDAQPHIFRMIESKRPVPIPEQQLPPEPVSIVVKEPLKPPTLVRKDVFDLQSLPGIGGQLAALLRADDIHTAEDLQGLGLEGLQKYNGVGKKKAEIILGALEMMQ